MDGKQPGHNVNRFASNAMLVSHHNCRFIHQTKIGPQHSPARIVIECLWMLSALKWAKGINEAVKSSVPSTFFLAFVFTCMCFRDLWRFWSIPEAFWNVHLLRLLDFIGNVFHMCSTVVRVCGASFPRRRERSFGDDASRPWRQKPSVVFRGHNSTAAVAQLQWRTQHESAKLPQPG